MGDVLHDEKHLTLNITVTNNFSNSPTETASSVIKRIVLEAVIMGAIGIPFGVATQIIINNLSLKTSSQINGTLKTVNESHEDLMHIDRRK